MPLFEDHKELLHCGDCPFLKISKKGSSEAGSGGIFRQLTERENECGVDGYYFGKIDQFKGHGWEILKNGDNPERKKGCLILAKHIHQQMAEAFET